MSCLYSGSRGLGSGVRDEKSLFSEPGGLRGPAADSEGVEGRFSARRPVLSGFRCAGSGGGHEMPPGLVPSLSGCTPLGYDEGSGEPTEWRTLPRT